MDLYYPMGRSYRGVFDGTTTDQFVLFEGRRGTAKTASILKILTYRAFRWPGTRYLIARSTRARLSESVIQTFDQHVLPMFKLPAPSVSATHRTGFDFPTIQGKRSRFIFMALDDPGRSQSVEADGAYISEATELESLEKATALTAAIRPRLEAEQIGVTQADPFPGLCRQVLLDCNPGPPAHWLNLAAEPADDSLRHITTRENYERTVAFNLAPARNGWKRIITSLPDNPGYWNRTAWEPTDACRRYLEGLGYMPPHMRARWLEGRWVAAEGGVFPEFTAERNTVAPFAVPADWPVWMCIDPGYDHPCGVSWNCIAPNGTAYTIAEIKVRQTGMDDLAALIERMGIGVVQVYHDPAGEQRRQETSGVNFRQLLAERGIKSIPWPFARGADHDASVAAHRKRIIDGNYKVFTSCPETIAEHQSWSYRRVRGGEIPAGDDQYEDSNNDLLDGLLGWERTNPVFARETYPGIAGPHQQAAPIPKQEAV